MAKKIRITTSHDRPNISASSAAVKRFSKSAGISRFPTKPPQDKDDEYEDIGGDDFGMDWGGCDDDNWEYGDTGEGVRGGGGDGGGDSVRPANTADNAPGAAVGWGAGNDGSGEGAMATKKEKEEEKHKEEPMVEEEKTVVYVNKLVGIRGHFRTIFLKISVIMTLRGRGLGP